MVIELEVGGSVEIVNVSVVVLLVDVLDFRIRWERLWMGRR